MNTKNGELWRKKWHQWPPRFIEQQEFHESITSKSLMISWCQERGMQGIFHQLLFRHTSLWLPARPSFLSNPGKFLHCSVLKSVQLSISLSLLSFCKLWFSDSILIATVGTDFKSGCYFMFFLVFMITYVSFVKFRHYHSASWKMDESKQEKACI